MHNFAPLLVITFNRYEHFKKCVESLSECTHAEKSDLYIALDYPLNESHWEGYKKISNYINEINAFKEVVIIKRDKNYGVLRNYNKAQQDIFKKYDRIIVSEDDNEFSPNFLDYINKGLEKFKDDENVIAICGHRPIIKIHKGYGFNYYYAKGFSAWGFGMWRGKYKRSVYNIDDLKEFINDKVLVNKLKKYYENHYYTVLNNIKNKKMIYGDGAIALDMIKNNKYCVYPIVSKVRNYGHDGSGVHCSKEENSIYARQEIDNNAEFEFLGEAPLIDIKINKELRRYSKVGFVLKVKRFIKNILLLISNRIK